MRAHSGFVSCENLRDVYGNFLIGSSRTEPSAHRRFRAFCPWHDTDAFGRCAQQRVKGKHTVRKYTSIQNIWKLTNIFIQSMAKTQAHKIADTCTRTHTHTQRGLHAHDTNKECMRTSSYTYTHGWEVCSPSPVELWNRCVHMSEFGQISFWSTETPVTKLGVLVHHYEQDSQSLQSMTSMWKDWVAAFDFS